MKLLLIFAILLSCTVTTAGPVVNNGGGGWRCRESGKTEWIKSVDLFELSESGVPAEKISAQKAAIQIFKEKRQSILKEIPNLARLVLKYDLDVNNLNFVAQTMEPIGDAFLYSRPPTQSCAAGRGQIDFVQIADYLVDDHLVISGQLWMDKSLSETDKGAILLHELMYKIFRNEFGDGNSYRARKAVGILFSNLDAKTRIEDFDYLFEFKQASRRADHVAGFVADVFCIASVTNSVTGLSQSETWSPGSAGGEYSVTIDQFVFHVSASGVDGIPDSMAILDRISLQESSLDNVRISLITQDELSLRFKSEEHKNEARLRCRSRGRN